MRTFFKILVLVCCMFILSNQAFCVEHDIVAVFKNVVRGEPFDLAKQETKIDYFSNITFPIEWIEISEESFQKHLSLEQLTKTLKNSEFKDKKKFLKKLKEFVKKGRELPAFEPFSLGQDDSSWPQKISFSYRQRNKVILTLARKYGSISKGVTAASFLIEAAIYSASLRPKELIDSCHRHSFFLTYGILSQVADGIVIGSDDIIWTKKAVRTICKAFNTVEKALPTLDFSLKVDKNFINKFVKKFSKFIRDCNKKGELNGNKFTEKDIRDGEILLKELAAARKFANTYQSKLYDDKLLEILTKPYSYENFEYMEKLESKFLDILGRFDFTTKPNFTSDIEDVPEKIAVHLIGHQASSLPSWYSRIWKGRQKIEIAKTVIAIRAFYIEKKHWPKNLEAVESWLGEAIGKDLFSKNKLFWDSENRVLTSSGVDEELKTNDDIQGYPYVFRR